MKLRWTVRDIISCHVSLLIFDFYAIRSRRLGSFFNRRVLRMNRSALRMIGRVLRTVGSALRTVGRVLRTTRRVLRMIGRVLRTVGSALRMTRRVLPMIFVVSQKGVDALLLLLLNTPNTTCPDIRSCSFTITDISIVKTFWKIIIRILISKVSIMYIRR